MLYQEIKIKRKIHSKSVLDYHKRRKLKKKPTKHSLYNKKETND